METIAAIILAILKAFPALEALVAAWIQERAANRETEALKRKQEKDAAVDASLETLSNP